MAWGLEWPGRQLVFFGILAGFARISREFRGAVFGRVALGGEAGEWDLYIPNNSNVGLHTGGYICNYLIDNSYHVY